MDFICVCLLFEDALSMVELLFLIVLLETTLDSK